jgi:hypothetical protein
MKIYGRGIASECAGWPLETDVSWTPSYRLSVPLAAS